ncbi:class C beta-lactamase-related serine hydrolase [Halieaceae bacterium IMCC14734]|uniref:Class C beta-lactamase-related serine hydrolase n=1 Tax=Candidatus Litorirhabdus singularis TaxID=2518993 RepID=A0ABT3TAT0_9GAMM|nr:serine hydrolase [Candidatus Litorirhabdus singularis]MCX2979401.1 class C beta-lactamase-related serine hydrolase [Candidatus Litorirhabdus singularis]
MRSMTSASAGQSAARRCCELLCIALPLLLYWSPSVTAAANYDEWLRQQLGGPAAGPSVSAAATIVSADTVLSQRAVGFADPVTGAPAQAATSAYRISSITKLFTAVALAQLLASGQIESLQDPVNRYLHDIQLSPNAGREVTIEHLVTHTAGFDYWQYGLYTREKSLAGGRQLGAADVLPLLPPYVRPAGQWAVYSNTGGALLGLLVEQVSGLSLGDYLRTQLFTPLGMQSTRLQGSGPSVELAHSYYLLVGGGGLLAQPLRAYSPFMALSMGAVSSAADMGRFMRMLLRGGELDGTRVLSSAAVEQLLQLRFRNHPAANGYGILFDIAQQTPTISLYMHNGATAGFNAHLLLAPQHDLAMFAVVAGSRAGVEGAQQASPQLLSAPGLLARFVREWVAPYHFPRVVSLPHTLVPEGDYITQKRALRSPEALFDLVRPPQQIQVRSVAGQYVSNGRPATEVAPGVYLAEGPYAYREMFSRHAGEPVMTVYGSNVLTRMVWWQQPMLLRNSLVVAVGLCGTGLLVLLLLSCGLNHLQCWLCPAGIGLLLAWPAYAAVQDGGLAALFWQLQASQPLPLQLAVTLSHLWLLWTGLWWLALTRVRRSCVVGAYWFQRVIALLVGSASLILLLVLFNINLLGPDAWRWWRT